MHGIFDLFALQMDGSLRGDLVDRMNFERIYNCWVF